MKVNVASRRRNWSCEETRTLFAIEHNLRFIGQAVWVIDMGLGAGSSGGKVLFEGAPLALMRRKDTPTARAMNAYFGFFKDAAV